MKEIAKKITQNLSEKLTMREFDKKLIDAKWKKIENKPESQKVPILWQWIKDDHINLKEFAYLITKFR